MIRLGFVLALCVCGNLAYNIGYDLEAMDREWSGAVPMPGTAGTGGGDGNSDCKKDMLILWDNSKSVGPTTFKNKVRPFLKDLIKSSKLNVGQDGTHIGILTFSTEEETKVLLELGKLQSPVALNKFLDSLKYKDISGDGTRTGMALKIADEKFSVSSPGNYRQDVADVVLIFTDGEPIRRQGENAFGDKYKNSYGLHGEGLLAKDRAQSLKDKNVTVIGLAVGTEDTLSKFRDNIKEWTTEGKYFETNKDSLNSIIDQLINASCIDPGECGCSGTITVRAFVLQGGKAKISWPKPILDCPFGQAIIKRTDVQPPGVSSGSEFGVGKHNVTYTFVYLRKTKEVKRKCAIEINVTACQCPGVVRVNAETDGGSNTAFVSWTIPKPNCPATLSGVSPPEARNGNGRYPIGKYDVSYNYEHSSASGSFSLSCPVKISIKACECPGVVRVNAEIAGGSKTAFVSWTIPEPNCPATLSDVSPPEARNGNGRYPIGKYDVSYNYEHSSASGRFSLSCPVKITIEGKCGGIRFGASQVCCCGTVHERKDGYDCCGYKYYDTGIQRCEDFSYTLVDISL